MSYISIFINGEEKEITQNITISQLLSDYNIDIEKVAVEKNLEIIDVNNFDKEIINQGDKIEIVHFIGGG